MIKAIAIGVLVLIVAAIPFALIAKARVATSTRPRIHGWRDMDYQEKFKPQQECDLFADRRAMRMPVPGTVARGELRTDTHFYEGYVGWPRDPKTGQPVKTPRWADTFPAMSYGSDGEPHAMIVDLKFVERGKQRFEIYCAPCHGYAGYGDGAVNQRALALVTSGKSPDTNWTQPANLHTKTKLPLGELFHVITDGRANMPSYRAQIPVKDRWAIVAYVKALQISQGAK